MALTAAWVLAASAPRGQAWCTGQACVALPMLLWTLMLALYALPVGAAMWHAYAQPAPPQVAVSHAASESAGGDPASPAWGAAAAVDYAASGDGDPLEAWHADARDASSPRESISRHWLKELDAGPSARRAASGHPPAAGASRRAAVSKVLEAADETLPSSMGGGGSDSESPGAPSVIHSTVSVAPARTKSLNARLASGAGGAFMRMPSESISLLCESPRVPGGKDGSPVRPPAHAAVHCACTRRVRAHCACTRGVRVHRGAGLPRAERDARVLCAGVFAGRRKPSARRRGRAVAAAAAEVGHESNGRAPVCVRGAWEGRCQRRGAACRRRE